MPELGILGAGNPISVTPYGGIHWLDRKMKVSWAIGADDRWHFAEQETTIRQNLSAKKISPETRVRVPGGDIEQCVDVIPVGSGSATMVEFENTTPVPVALALILMNFDELTVEGPLVKSGSSQVMLASKPVALTCSAKTLVDLQKALEETAAKPSNAGEIIKKGEETKKSLLNKEVMVILISDDTIRGELIKELDKQITISSSTIGSITLERKNIKSIIDISNEGVFLERKRDSVESSNPKPSNDILPPNYSQITSEAKKEGKENNNHFSNIILGTGSAIIWPTIPLTLVYVQKGPAPKPNSYFYNNLDEKSQSTYKKIYEKQYRQTKLLQTITGPVVSCGVFVGTVIVFAFFVG